MLLSKFRCFELFNIFEICLIINRIWMNHELMLLVLLDKIRCLQLPPFVRWRLQLVKFFFSLLIQSKWAGYKSIQTNQLLQFPFLGSELVQNSFISCDHECQPLSFFFDTGVVIPFVGKKEAVQWHGEKFYFYFAISWTAFDPTSPCPAFNVRIFCCSSISALSLISLKE